MALSLVPRRCCCWSRNASWLAQAKTALQLFNAIKNWDHLGQLPQSLLALRVASHWLLRWRKPQAADARQCASCKIFALGSAGWLQGCEALGQPCGRPPRTTSHNALIFRLPGEPRTVTARPSVPSYSCRS